MLSILKIIGVSVIYWTFAILVVTTFRFVGIDFFVEIKPDTSLLEIYLTAIPGGIIGGFIFGFVEIINSKIKSKKRKSFGMVICSKTIGYTIIFLIVSFFASWLGSVSFNTSILYLTSPISIGNFVFFILATFLFHFIKQMGRNFGPGVLLHYVTGKYFHPKVENKIFMFLDLKSSTAIAEKLDHVLYSQLIQDCFAQLTLPLKKNKGQVYQYVGDEVVITWTIGNGLKNGNCINFYFDYVKKLAEKKDYYIKKYAVLPVFKAGLNSGLVSVAEVGELKTEIAYHGDVLNTASRIQKKCNEFNKNILISESLIEHFENQSLFTFNLIDNILLKGKEKSIAIYNVEPANNQ